MNKRKLLYISSNDGSDMRINKELRTLSSKFDITYVGVGQSNIESFAAEYCKYFYLVVGRRNHIGTILKQFLLVLRLIRKHHTVHVINEQLMIFFYPLLFRKYLVLDIFDSIFFILNKSGERWKLLKRIVYAPVNKILVTDMNRKNLMPVFTHPRIEVLENYPLQYDGPMHKKQTETVTILYNGWLGVNRGTEVIEKLIAGNNNIRVIMAGWFADTRSRALLKSPKVDYRGVMTQYEALKIAANEADYILCVYSPINENNINASPNKIYDSIQTRTPVIINADVKIASLVDKLHLGIIIRNYGLLDADELVRQLNSEKGKFYFDQSIIDAYTWERIEEILVKVHRA